MVTTTARRPSLAACECDGGGRSGLADPAGATADEDRGLVDECAERHAGKARTASRNSGTIRRRIVRAKAGREHERQDDLGKRETVGEALQLDGLGRTTVLAELGRRP